ncbi:MAG: acetate--CoA ligase family protein [Thermodesulfovibrionales bacterium]|nr:acetate--CoA ligase family protein [Thermodesulfovibrionales bacterium]
MITEFLERHKGKTSFLEHEVKGLLKDMGLSVPNGVFTAKGETLRLPAGLSYPLVAKVSSSKIASKSDVRGVRLGIRNENELETAVRELFEIEDAEGALIEETAPAGVEVIIGGIIDRQFGPVVMFGLGGVFVELSKDVAFALAPLTREDSHWIVRQVKSYRLLEGVRGRPPSDLNALSDIIVAVGEIISTGLIREIDLNPVAVYPRGALILDAKASPLPPG